MAGNSTPELIAAVSNAGGLGSYGCAMLSREQLADECKRIRTLSNRSFNLNFFCHAPPNVTAEQEDAWRAKLAPYYAELDVEVGSSAGGARRPFDEETCDAVLAIGPRVVSFHFGMPKPGLVQRLKAAGMVLMSSATTSAEARRLVDLGADVIVAQGFEAGGHRGMFSDVRHQLPGRNHGVGPAGGRCGQPAGHRDRRDCGRARRGSGAGARRGCGAGRHGLPVLPAGKVSAPHRAALRGAHDDETVLTNLFTGRPARGLVNRFIRELGPINATAPQFPTAANAVTPLRAEAERRGSSDFSPLWSGQAAALAREVDAADLTRSLAAGMFEVLGDLGDAARSAQGRQRTPAHN